MPNLTVSAAVDTLMQCADVPAILEYLGIAPAPWVDIGTTYTATTFQKINADVSSSAFTIDLPASPAHGDWVRIQDEYGNAGTNPITVDGNGQSIMGSPSQFNINTNDASYEFVFVGGERGWRAQVIG